MSITNNKTRFISKINWSKIFGNKDFIKQAIKLFFPAIIQNIIISSIAYVDNFFLATYTPLSQGLDAKTATILATQLLYLPMIFTVAVTYACSIISSQYRGNNEIERFRQSINYMIIASVIINLPFIIIYIAIPEWSINTYAGTVNNLQKGSQAISATEISNFQKTNLWAARYLRIAMIAQCFYIFSYPFASAHRQDSKPIIPLFGSIAALLLNLILNPILLIVYAKTPEQAIDFVGYSTIASRGLDMLIVLVIMLIRKKQATFIFKSWQLSIVVLKQILRYGWHVAINEIIFSVATILISLFLYKYHPDIRASVSTAALIAQFTKLIWPGASTVTAVLVLAYLGRDEIKKAKEHANYLIAWGLVVSLFLALILFIASWFINPVLNPPASDSIEDLQRAKEIVELSMRLEWVLVAEVAFLGAYAIINNCLRGSGKIYVALTDMSLMIIWVIMMVLISEFAYNPKINGLWSFALVESIWLAKLIVAIILFTKTKWARSLIKPNISDNRKEKLNEQTNV